MGAQWIHGQTGNVAYKLAFAQGLVDLDSSADEDTFGEQFQFVYINM